VPDQGPNAEVLTHTRVQKEDWGTEGLMQAETWDSCRAVPGRPCPLLPEGAGSPSWKKESLVSATFGIQVCCCHSCYPSTPNSEAEQGAWALGPGIIPGATGAAPGAKLGS
jgi:hypothetical protein